MTTVLVTSAGSGASNNLMRSLRTCEEPVRLVGTSIAKHHLAQSPVDVDYLVPRADAGRDYVKALCAIVERERVDLIIPNNDVEVPLVSGHRTELGALTFLPSHPTIELCQDKYALARHLDTCGIRVARTCLVESADDAERAFRTFGDAACLWCRMRAGTGSRGSLPVRRPDQLRFWIQYWQDMHGIPPNTFTLSDYLPGRDFAVQSLWHDGQIVLAKTCERLSYLFSAITPSGTSSTPRVGKLVNDPRVNDICMKTVRAVDPQANGLFCIDAKQPLAATKRPAPYRRCALRGGLHPLGLLCVGVLRTRDIRDYRATMHRPGSQNTQVCETPLWKRSRVWSTSV